MWENIDDCMDRCEGLKGIRDDKEKDVIARKFI
jgi:hypothetical protein